jgi:hypothetical protein
MMINPAINKAILVLLIALPFIAFGQLSGEYCHNFGFGAECINFLKHNKFEYSSTGCTGNDLGIGVYEIKRGTLTLYFQTDSSKLEKGPEIMPNPEDYPDSIAVKLALFDIESKEPIPFATIRFKNSDDRLVLETSTDLEGRSDLKLPKSADKYICSVSSTGYRNYSFIVEGDKSITVNLSMSSGFDRYYGTGDNKVFKIIKLGRKRIALKHSYIGADYEVYIKK